MWPDLVAHLGRCKSLTLYTAGLLILLPRTRDRLLVECHGRFLEGRSGHLDALARPWLITAKAAARVSPSFQGKQDLDLVAQILTTPSDLTAFYNLLGILCLPLSAPILREPLRFDKSVAVFIAIIGLLVVAYGDTGGDVADPGAGPGNKEPSAGSRFVGNLVIGIGSVLYGLYEILYKRYACPPEGVSPDRGTIFANTFGACIGLFTLTVLWTPLPILHILDIEKFELPTGSTGWLVCQTFWLHTDLRWHQANE